MIINGNLLIKVVVQETIQILDLALVLIVIQKKTPLLSAKANLMLILNVKGMIKLVNIIVEESM